MATALRHERVRLLRAALALLWLVLYVRSVKRIKVHHKGRGNSNVARERLVRILDRCPSLLKTYWPAWFAPTAILQFGLLGFKEFRGRFLQTSPYRRELVDLRDGESIGLDWIAPVLGKDPTLPVCILLHGAFQDSASVTMTDLGRALAKRGLPVVVMNRRGYGGVALTRGKLPIFGDDDDLDEVVALVAKREPDRCIAIVGFSCGAVYAGRYAGKRTCFSSWAARSGSAQPLGNGSSHRILCGVMYDSGYDAHPDAGIAKICFPYNWVINWALKFFYAFRHHNSLLTGASQATREGVLDMLSPSSGAVDTFKASRRLSGMYSGPGDSSAWLDKQQPQLRDVKVPSIYINSRDDPICVWGNVEANRKELESNPSVALVELQQGAHGCKFGFWGFDCIVEPMIGEFVEACWQELKTHQEAVEANDAQNQVAVETSY